MQNVQRDLFVEIFSLIIIKDDYTLQLSQLNELRSLGRPANFVEIFSLIMLNK